MHNTCCLVRSIETKDNPIHICEATNMKDRVGQIWAAQNEAQRVGVVARWSLSSMQGSKVGVV